MKTIALFIVLALTFNDLRASSVTADTVVADEVRTGTITGQSLSSEAVLYYSFEENMGNTIQDHGAGGYNGTASGCTWTSAGRFNGGAMSFAGNNSKITVGSEPNFPTWERYTVSAWFLHNGGGDFGSSYGHKIIDKTSMYHDWHMRLYPYGTSPGNVSVSMYEQSGNRTGGFRGTTNNCMDNMWHHMVVVRDGTNGHAWIDGVLTDARTDMFSVYSSSALCIGNSLSTDSYQRKGWSGLIDEVMIFDRALSEEEVLALYNTGNLNSIETGPPPVTIDSDVVVNGSVVASGAAVFEGGIRHILPMGDLSSGIYTNSAPPVIE